MARLLNGSVIAAMIVLGLCGGSLKEGCVFYNNGRCSSPNLGSIKIQYKGGKQLCLKS